MKKRKLLLDIGCGEAWSCIHFSKEGYSVIGIEKNPDVFKKAKKNVEISKEKQFIKLYNKDIKKMRLSKKFDGILCNYVLMFMSKKDFSNIVEKLYNKLNDKGEMIIKMLMFDDPVAINSSKKETVFFPSYNDLRKLKKQYKGELKFKLLRDKAHNGYNFPHIHSVGISKIIK